MPMRVHANDDFCIAAMQCSATAPGVFGHDEIGVVTVLDPQPPAESHEAVRRAARICPSAAISITED